MLHFIWILAYLYGYAKSEVNPCIDYQTVDDTLIDMNRDDIGGSRACKPFPESFIPSWYRINGTLIGNVVALECPDSSSCGGTTNIWINDQLPGQNDGIKDVIACGSTSEGCCAIRSHINVKNCKHFYVFELRRLPRCDAKYCFNMTVNGLETEFQRSETSTESSSVLFTTKEHVASKSTNATTSISSSSFQTHSSGLFTTRKQVTSKSTTTISSSSAPSKSFSSPVSTVLPPSTPIILPKSTAKEDGHLISTIDESTQEMSNELQSRTIAVTTVSTGQTTSKSTSSDAALILTVTVSVVSVILAIFIFVVVIACLRRRRNVRNKKRRETSLQIRFYSTSKDYHL
ncbi:uncharacterized protein LOC132742351 [Ruditapes philippinarum]|uniref:uncharacterized protein LOC132742351 n=1 Tax=Ruditapes philippinarum TaxID=129788 RepID=UPI00295C37C8|nr:uncharacterized protein LOC132742351 [Ruditapes philippinarum]